MPRIFNHFVCIQKSLTKHILVFYILCPRFKKTLTFLTNDHLLTEHGYVTSFSEDTARGGTFQHRLMGFNDAPTDYYTRPFFLAAEDKLDEENMHCIGSQETYGYQLDLATEIYEQYQDRKKFLFHFAGNFEPRWNEEQHLCNFYIVAAH